MSQYAESYRTDTQHLQGVATRFGLNPEDVLQLPGDIGPAPTMQDIQAAISKKKGQIPPQPGQPKALKDKYGLE
jgi:hypothetical protein